MGPTPSSWQATGQAIPTWPVLTERRVCVWECVCVCASGSGHFLAFTHWDYVRLSVFLCRRVWISMPPEREVCVWGGSVRGVHPLFRWQRIGDLYSVTLARDSEITEPQMRRVNRPAL